MTLVSEPGELDSMWVFLTYIVPDAFTNYINRTAFCILLFSKRTEYEFRINVLYSPSCVISTHVKIHTLKSPKPTNIQRLFVRCHAPLHHLIFFQHRPRIQPNQMSPRYLQCQFTRKPHTHTHKAVDPPRYRLTPLITALCRVDPHHAVRWAHSGMRGTDRLYVHPHVMNGTLFPRVKSATSVKLKEVE